MFHFGGGGRGGDGARGRHPVRGTGGDEGGEDPGDAEGREGEEGRHLPRVPAGAIRGRREEGALAVQRDRSEDSELNLLLFCCNEFLFSLLEVCEVRHDSFSK